MSYGKFTVLCWGMLLFFGTSFSDAVAESKPPIDWRMYRIEEIQSSLIETQVLSERENLPEDVKILLNSAKNAHGNPPVLPDFQNMDLDLATIINFGKQLWQILESGRSVVDFKTDSANALPKGTHDWSELENWSDPRAYTYRVSMKNLYGMETVSFNYRLIAITGGTYNGVGQYIAYASVAPSDVNVAWGFNLSAVTKIPVVYNKASRQNPMAAMQIELTYVVTSAVSHIENTESFYLKGDGELRKIQ